MKEDPCLVCERVNIRYAAILVTKDYTKPICTDCFEPKLVAMVEKLRTRTRKPLAEEMPYEEEASAQKALSEASGQEARTESSSAKKPDE